MQKDIKQILLETKKNCAKISAQKQDILDELAKLLKEGKNRIYFKSTLCDKDTISIGKKIRQLTSIFEALFIIESRVDLAKILECDGVLLNENDISETDARKILDDDKIILFEKEEQ